MAVFAFAGFLGACAPGPSEELRDGGEVGEEATPGSANRTAEAPAPPTGPGAFAPQLSAAPGGFWLSWLEPVTRDDKPAGHRLMAARRNLDNDPDTDPWSPPVEVQRGSGFFANWADVPSVVEHPDGTLLAHWLEKTGKATYAYGVRLARSTDGGATWRVLGFLHDDGTPTEHGFVSLWPEVGEAGSFRALWLDGRAMLDGGPMSLRTAQVGEAVTAARVLDRRVCDCCPTTAVATLAGAVVAYRDRSPEEVRDVYAARWNGEIWSDPAPVARDGWVFPACPVNGPAVAARGSATAVAWFTGEGDEPRVQVAFNADGGAPADGDFTGSVEVDRQAEGTDSHAVLGRVALALPELDEAVVAWMTSEGGQEKALAGRLWVRRVHRDGDLGEPRLLARTDPGRVSGMPRLLVQADDLHAVWVEVADGEPRGLAYAQLPWRSLPAP